MIDELHDKPIQDIKSKGAGGFMTREEMEGMRETLEQLPGEGDTEIIIKTRLRRECDVCGDAAHYKHTFLLEGARNNSASSAYGQDDCSWCEDEARYVYKKHKKDRAAPSGYSWCSTFPANAQFSHLFLYWEEAKPVNLL